jgi:hypothetical protein
MKGNREERAILIRDPNRIVTAAVLSSPKMNDTEVASIAKMQNVSEDVLRTIAHNRAWLKNYSVVLAVVKNPKTPVALSMNLMARLSEKDLKLLSTDRNVPDALRRRRGARWSSRSRGRFSACASSFFGVTGAPAPGPASWAPSASTPSAAR